MDFKVVIPARYASSRLPGKPLLEISGKPMIQHVFERGCESAADEVVIATDNQRIRQQAEAFGATVCMTSESHRSGTERIAEVAEKLGWADDVVVVNLQGDEPTMPPSLIQQVAEDMDSHPRAGVTTLYTPIDDRDDLFDPHVVKVVLDAEGYALLFSRAPVPWHRDEFLQSVKQLPAGVLFARHIGLYAYRVGYLKQYVSWPPAPLEQAESLEQLRVLWHGGCIHVSKAVATPGHGVDTGDDLLRVRDQLGE